MSLIVEILEKKRIKLIAPTLFNGKPVSQAGIHEHQICKERCSDRQCSYATESIGEFLCDNGLSYFNGKVDGSMVCIYGIRGAKSKVKSGRQLTFYSFNEWVLSLSELYFFINSFVKDKVDKERSEFFYYLHDPARWANLACVNLEKVINQNTGKIFSEKFSNADDNLKSAFQASKMLVDSFELISVQMNPDSAKFGDKKHSNIYKLFDKIQAIIFHSEGRKNNRRFRFLNRNFTKEIPVYESFSIIPLALLQNAMKYTLTGEIEIEIFEKTGSVSVSIASDGVLMEQDEISYLFDKGFRGRYAQGSSIEGIGIGLFAAQIVANAHDFSIKAISKSKEFELKGIPVARNEFYFSMPF